MVENKLYDLGLKTHRFLGSDAGVITLSDTPGELISIVCPQDGGSNVIIFYDNVGGTADQIGLLVNSDRQEFTYNLPLRVGLTVNLAATNRDAVFIYR